ncbi:hypothetical protein FQA39_LY01455 [Lamprigera yunnana]|nr:hypothetical protein FQA39_LY01455 [Lamprigera yunnana]
MDKNEFIMKCLNDTDNDHDFQPDKELSSSEGDGMDVLPLVENLVHNVDYINDNREIAVGDKQNYDENPVAAVDNNVQIANITKDNSVTEVAVADENTQKEFFRK